MNVRSTLRLNTGRSMPVFGLGTWQLTNDTPGTVEHAIHLGYRMIDTAADYGTQPGIGEAIRRAGVAREQLYIVAKVEEDENAYEATRQNLTEMKRDYADLMLIHRPPPETAGVELWDGLIRARNYGLTKDIGVSNYAPEQIEELIAATGEVPAVNQIEWSPFGWSPETLDYCRQRNIVIQAYSPLTRAKRLDNDKLNELAEEYSKTPAQILLRWNLQLGTVPLPKANQFKHLKENLDLFDFQISETHMEQLNHLNEHYSALGVLPYV